MTAAAPAADHFAPNGAGMDHCPAHDDRHRSLSVREGDDGRLLLKCQAGCSVADIVAAKGLTMSDLFVPDLTILPGGEPEAVYDYLAADGSLAYQVVRWGKGRVPPFTMRGPNGEPSVKGIERVPYRLPELLAADPSRAVVIVEGEKDVDRLRAENFVATCNAGGAGPDKWHPEWAEYLAGRRVVIIPDNDDPGRQHAASIAASVNSVATEVRIVTLPDVPPKGDVSDYLNAGHSADDLKRLVASTPVQPKPPSRFEWLHTIVVPEGETVMALEPFVLDEGPAILFGDGDTGKSAFALVLAESMASGRELIPGLRPTVEGPVMWIDYEAQRLTTRRRQQRIGVEGGVIYVPGLRPLQDDVDELRNIVDREGVVLAVVDSVVASVGGRVSPKDAESPNLYAQAINAIAPRSLGIGHVTKSNEDDGSKPFGSVFWHNVARLTWNAKRDHDEAGHVVRLYCRKRNDGPRFDPQEVRFDWSDGGLGVEVSGQVRHADRIADVLRDGPMTVADISSAIEVPEKQVRTALTRNQPARFVSIPGAGVTRWRLA